MDRAPHTANMGNPYRRPRPPDRATIVEITVYPADHKGNYPMNARSFPMVLCAEYLWVTDALSIPLAAIANTGLTKHGGYIVFWDALAGVNQTFYFTKVGFVRFKRKDVERFLDLLAQQIAANAAAAALAPPTPPAAPDLADEIVPADQPEDAYRCEHCPETDVGVYTFWSFRFVGIVPFAYVYRLTPKRCVLCAAHAPVEARRCSLHTALFGYLGFPGFLASPWYVYKNLRALRQAGVADTGTTLFCVLACILLPLALIATPIILLVRCSAGGFGCALAGPAA